MPPLAMPCPLGEALSFTPGSFQPDVERPNNP